MQSRAPGLKRNRFVEGFSILKYAHQLSRKDIEEADAYHQEVDEVQRAFVEFSVNEAIN